MLTPEREKEIREYPTPMKPDYGWQFEGIIAELLAEVDRVRKEKSDWRETVRDQDKELDQLREKLAVAVEALIPIQGGAGYLSNPNFYSTWDKGDMMACAKDALAKIKGEK